MKKWLKKKGSNEKVHGIYLFINYYFANKHENCICERIEEKKKKNWAGECQG